MSDTIFVNGLFVKKGNFGFKVSMCKEDLMQFFDEHGTKSEKNGKTYVNIEMNESKDGENAYAKLDTWKPDPNYKKEETTETATEDKSLPF